MKKGKIMLILILGGLLVISSGHTHQINGQNDLQQPVASIHGITAYVEQEPIAIWNDSAFEEYASAGSGEPGDPYCERPLSVDSPGKHLSTRRLLYRDRFPRYGSLIDR